MAVVQISKIQVRRGQKNSISGVPQLSSAEFAWAVDTQELFIGNGSVAEGAPFVGNTKILTEHDNILELANDYIFAGTNPAISSSVPRSLQDKLDEYVSVTDFGAVGDGSTNCVTSFETAFTQLFRNSNDIFKKILVIPNGEYLFTSDLRIPSNTILVGESKSGVILRMGANNIRFINESGEEFVDIAPTDAKPNNIHIGNFTISRTTGQTVLSGVTNFTAKEIVFQGDYELGDAYSSIPTIIISSIVSNVCTTSSNHGLELGDRIIPRTSSNGLVANTKYYIISIPAADQFVLSKEITGTAESLTNGGPLSDPSIVPPLASINLNCDVISDVITSLSTQTAAVYWNNILLGTRATDLRFEQCDFKSNHISIKCLQTAVFETEVLFDRCNFFVNDTAIYIQGVEGQINQWKIDDCQFKEIANQAFRSTNGTGTVISRSKFRNCGNGTSATTPEDYIVYFGEKSNNLVVDCSSDRQQISGIVSTDSVVAIPEVYNGDKTVFVDRNQSVVYLSDNFRPLAVFSALNRYIVVKYFLSLGSYSRYGDLTITVGDTQSEVSITDNYQYSSPLATSTGGTLMTNFEFAVDLADNDLDSGIETIVLSYKNPLPGFAGTISFDVAYGV